MLGFEILECGLYHEQKWHTVCICMSEGCSDYFLVYEILKHLQYFIIRDSKKPSQNKRLVCKRFSLSLSTLRTFFQSLQKVWIQKIVQGFAEPDQAQTKS